MSSEAGMKSVRCPYCGATFQVPATVQVAVCPYCGTTIWLNTGQVFKEHYMYPIRVEFNKAYDNVLGLAERQFAAPEDIRKAASPDAGRIHFVPLYLYHVKVRAECPGNPEAGLEEEWVSRLAVKNPIQGLSINYRFPTRGRRFFEPRTLERGKYYQPDLDPKELLSEVTSRATLKALREAYNWCDEPKIVNESKWEGIVHYPFWEIRYSYNGRKYYALVDATDGTVVYLEYPIGTKKRGYLLSAAAGLLLGGMVIGAGLGYAIGSTTAGLAGGAVSSLPGVYKFLSLGVSRVGRYVLGERFAREDS
ncbi:MAG: zinc ribbon domain-containing protein [Desulfurococcales archaeon]|nr:zinc ribbon domain-containing protein [Desulfurococcales archaeon]